MNVQTNSNKKGFTIIEVVLVLAIAGLIFLMVFIALPALQRSQRDQARKADVSSVAAAVTSYTSNNRGADFPDAEAILEYADVSENIDGIFIGPTNAESVAAEKESDIFNHIIVTPRTICGASSTTSQAIQSGTARQFTVVVKLESGKGAYFCLDS